MVGGLLGVAGHFMFKTSYAAGAQLMRQESAASFRASEVGEPFTPRQLSVATLVSFMRSSALVQRLAEQTRIPARAIVRGLTIAPERNTDLINLTFASTQSPETAVRILNAFGNEVVRLTRDMQSQESAAMNRMLKRQIAKTEDELRAVNQELLDFSRQTGIINADREIEAYLRSLGDFDMRLQTARIDYETLDLKIGDLERELSANNPLAEHVQAARDRLNELLQQYTDSNPYVLEQKANLAELEARLKESEGKPAAPPRQSETGIATSFYVELLNLRTQKKVTAAQVEKLKTVSADLGEKLRGLPEKDMQMARIKARRQSLEVSQSLLASRQREAQLYEDNALGYYRFFESRLDEVERAEPAKKLVMLALGGVVFGALFAVAFVCLVESLDDRIKTAADLKRVSKLPLLATMPDLAALDGVAQSNWAFSTWLALQAKLAAGPNGEVVSGFVSASLHEGCSTWVELLARAASQRNESVVVVMNRPPVTGTAIPLAEALAHPSRVAAEPGRTQWLLAPADWRWDTERRRQWQAALEIWSHTAELVVLAELTTADQPETLLFAERLPHLIWLAGSGMSRTHGTSERLQTFQNAGCRFAGAVLNREVKLFPWL